MVNFCTHALTQIHSIEIDLLAQKCLKMEHFILFKYDTAPNFIQFMTMTINKAYDLNFSLEFFFYSLRSTFHFTCRRAFAHLPFRWFFNSHIHSICFFSACRFSVWMIAFSFWQKRKRDTDRKWMKKWKKNKMKRWIIGIHSFLHARFHIFSFTVLLLWMCLQFPIDCNTLTCIRSKSMCSHSLAHYNYSEQISDKVTLVPQHWRHTILCQLITKHWNWVLTICKKYGVCHEL